VGATLVGLAFILPSFLMVLGLSALYVAYGGMPWMQSVFYGIGAVIIAIIAIAAYRLARGTNKRDPLLWTIFVVMLAATAWTGTELAVLFLVAGLLDAIAGAVAVLGRGAIVDLPTACIALTGLVLLIRFRLPEPLLVLGAGLAGLALSRQCVDRQSGTEEHHGVRKEVLLRIV
jgi:chromate transporter